jgi:hypothetical protein
LADAIAPGAQPPPSRIRAHQASEGFQIILAALLAVSMKTPSPPAGTHDEMARYHATFGADRPCRSGTADKDEILVCGSQRRSPYRLPLPDARPPLRAPGEVPRGNIGGSPARIPPGFGLTLTVPIGKAPGPGAPAKATIQGTGDALDK